MTISKTQRGRAAAAVSIAAVLALTATACGDDGSGSGTEGSGKGEITFWDNNGGPRTAVWTEIIKDFEKQNPDIKVKYVPIPIADVQSKYDTAIAGGGLPDVGGVGTAYLANMVSQEALEPVNDRLEKSALRGKLVESMVESVRAAAGRGDDVYSVPTSANNGVLWYRTDLFEQAGLKAPDTWANFYTAADKLTAVKNNKFGYTIRGGYPSPRRWTPSTDSPASPSSGTATGRRSTTRRTSPLWRSTPGSSSAPRPRPTSTTTSRRWWPSGTPARSAC